MRAVRVIGIICMIVGILIYLTPQIREIQLQQEVRTVLQVKEPEETQNDSREKTETADDDTASENLPPADEDDLYAQMEAYNRRLFEAGQEFSGTKTYEQNPLGVDGPIGLVRIPDMDVELPLYLGATYEHLDKGAAVLGGTSMPVGGINTNCVISGHRSWCGAPYFRDIDQMRGGSLVEIRTERETLYYRAFDKRIILPDDTSAVMIREGKDMVTLITCHPYLGGGTHRYVVYCERSKEEGKKEESAELPEKETSSNSSAEDKEEVQEEQIPTENTAEIVHTEKLVRCIMAALITAGIVVLFCCEKQHKK